MTRSRVLWFGCVSMALCLLIAGPASATHESSQTCYGRLSDIHGHDGDQSYDDRSGNFLTALMAGGRDAVFGDDLDDRLCGQGDPDHLRGQFADDRINGGQGADELFGADGSDVLNGGDGVNDYCDGGPGNDVFSDCECGPNTPC